MRNVSLLLLLFVIANVSYALGEEPSGGETFYSATGGIVAGPRFLWDDDDRETFSLGANLTFLTYNLGVEYIDEDIDGDEIARGYIGVGMGGLIQLQRGWGHGNKSTRIRSDLNIVRLFQKGKYPELHSLQRLAFPPHDDFPVIRQTAILTLTYDRYDNESNEFSIGMGVVF